MNKLAISFWIWGIFADNIFGDFDNAMAELKQRGFNCVRLEDGAGLMCSPDGSPRGDVRVYEPFGEHGRCIRQFIVKDGTINVRERLLKLFAAAEKHDVKIILSSWYYLHTNWFFGNEINNELFAMSTEEKFEYFSDELCRILDFIREHNFIHRVAFAEIFNEVDDFARDIPVEEAPHLKAMHEKAIDKLQKKHPDVLFACDVSTPYVNEAMLPSNADVLNFHSYYSWYTYRCFEKEATLNWSLTPETTQFLKETITTPELLKEAFRGRNLKVKEDWIYRICLYSSIDPEKLPALEQTVAEDFERSYDTYTENLRHALATATGILERNIPNAKLVMGEGVTYCPHNDINFEEKGEKYKEILLYQAKLFRESNICGTVVRTTSGPEDKSWELLKDTYLEANKIFLS